jgi:hypothetical protein
MQSLTDPSGKDHELTFFEDGNWSCSCGEWGSQRFGSLNDEYSKKWGLTKEKVIKNHQSHRNALVVDISRLAKRDEHDREQDHQC